MSLEVFIIQESDRKFLLQRPRQHQAKNGNDQSDMQEQIGCRKKTAGKNKLDQ